MTDRLAPLIGVAHLNAVLERAGVLGCNRHVQNVTVISDVATLMSRVVRLRLSYDAEADNLPGSLVVKTGVAARGSEWSNGRQEVAFYRDVAPSLSAGLVPRCFEAYDAGDANPSHLVLEDLTDTHAVASE